MNNRLDTIHAILYGSMHPRRHVNDLGERRYHQMLKDVLIVEPQKNLAFKLDALSHLFFTSRIRYYCRLIDINVFEYMNHVVRTIEQDGSTEIIMFFLKSAREEISTCSSNAAMQLNLLNIDWQHLTASDAEFNSNRKEKECDIIFQYIIASLCLLWMELQELYRAYIDENDVMDIPTFFTSLTGRPSLPLFNVSRVKKAENTKKVKRSDCSFLYIYDKEYWNINLQAFFNKLIEYKQIPSDTDLKLFFQLFSGKSTTVILEWTGDKPVLAELVRIAINKGYITVFPEGCTHWEVVSSRFTFEGKPMPYLGKVKKREKDKTMIADLIAALRG